MEDRQANYVVASFAPKILALPLPLLTGRPSSKQVTRGGPDGSSVALDLHTDTEQSSARCAFQLGSSLVLLVLLQEPS